MQYIVILICRIYLLFFVYSIRYHEPVHGVMDVRDFKASLDRRTHQFEGVKRQHDAHEFLVTLLALLEEDMEKSIDYSIKEQSFFPGRRDINTPAKLDTSSKSKLSLHHDAPVTSTVVAALTDININININNNNEDTYTSSRNGNTIEDSNRTSYNHLTSSSVSDSNGSHLSRILPSDLVLRSLNLVDQVTTPTATKGLDNRDSYIHGIIDASNHNSGSGCSRTTVDTTTSADTSRSLGSTSWHHDRNDNDNDNDNDDEWLMRLKRRLVPSCVPALSHFTTDVRMSFECTACKHGREPKHVLSAQLTQY